MKGYEIWIREWLPAKLPAEVHSRIDLAEDGKEFESIQKNAPTEYRLSR